MKASMRNVSQENFTDFDTYYATADEVIYDITTNMKEDFVYVIYNDKKILSKAEYIMSLSQLNRNIVICFPSIDKSSDFYKQNNKYK